MLMFLLSESARVHVSTDLLGAGAEPAVQTVRARIAYGSGGREASLAPVGGAASDGNVPLAALLERWRRETPDKRALIDVERRRAITFAPTRGGRIAVSSL